MMTFLSGTRRGLLVLALSGVVTAVASAQTPTKSPTPAAPGGAALELQVLLDRAGFSPGEIDGQRGANTDKAVAAFARARNVDAADDNALRLALGAPETLAIVPYTVTVEDAKGPFTRQIPEDMMEKAKLDALNYTSALEALAERFHASPALLRKLNPGKTFAAGDEIQVPNVVTVDPNKKVAAPKGVVVTVSKSASTLTATDATGAVLLHAPVTSGSERDPLPIGEWAVTAVSRNPTFNYNPDLFWDADPAHAKAKIPAGPNGPVGVVWIDLSKEHYGIHGSPEPSKIGKTTSHGCVRLTNWDAVRLAALVDKGTRVVFTE